MRALALREQTLRQVLDAASPANCLATNPEALKTALAELGASVVTP